MDPAEERIDKIMGTRGAVGYVVDGDVRLTYNHYDSYFTGLGVAVGKFAATLHGERLTEYANKARVMKFIDEQSTPTAEEREKYGAFADPGVSTGEDWYSLLRNAQGNLQAYLDLGIMPDNTDFAHDSLFCEYAYAVNFDTGVVEVYRGFQQDPARVKGRFANGGTENGYASITLLGTIPFTLADSATFWERLEVAVSEAEDDDSVITATFERELTA